jgi:uncharacterized protein
MPQPYLARIRIYPIKSLDPVELETAGIGVRSLRYDREFALLTPDGRFMNGKRTGRVNELKAEYDLANYSVTFMPRAGGETTTFHLIEHKNKLENYLSTFFGEPVTLLHNTQGRLLDVPDASSVTVISEASYKTLESELVDFPLPDIRLRFRANLEIGGAEPFWEETLIGPPSVGMRFRVGEVEMVGVSPRVRCNVPPRDPHTGVPEKNFVRRVMKAREATLPHDSVLPAHGGFYHLTVDTYLPDTETGKVLHVGDKVEIIGPVVLGQPG